jgi:hypothetical protein
MVLFCQLGKVQRGESIMIRRITLLTTASFVLAAFALPALSQDVLPRPEQPFKDTSVARSGIPLRISHRRSRRQKAPRTSC